MFNGTNVNTNNSTAKTQIDNWYNTNLSSYASYIEDTIYCNDRSISQLNGWDPNGGNTTLSLIFSPRNRVSSTYTPTLECSRAIDRFTVSSTKGNRSLTVPIGLLTSDEIMYAGGKFSTDNSTYYLKTNQSYWLLSPNYFKSTRAGEIVIYSDGSINNLGVNASNVGGVLPGLRPVVSLKSTDIVESGDGTSTNPYVIKTS